MYPAIRRFAAVVGPADVEPDDLVQEAFERALRRGLEGIDDLGAYLPRCILNLSANERRRWVRQGRAYVRSVDRTDDVPSYPTDVADLLRLDPESRAVLWLAEVEGWTYREIGELLGCAEDALRVRASRARRTLRTHLAGEEASCRNR